MIRISFLPQCPSIRERSDGHGPARATVAAVWITDVEPLLRRDLKGVLEAKLVLEVLRMRYADAVSGAEGPGRPGTARSACLRSSPASQMAARKTRR